MTSRARSADLQTNRPAYEITQSHDEKHPANKSDLLLINFNVLLTRLSEEKHEAGDFRRLTNEATITIYLLCLLFAHSNVS